MYAGWQNFPHLCARLLIDFPYLHDLIKYENLKWEFLDPEKAKKKQLKLSKYAVFFAGLVGYYVNLLQQDPQSYKGTVYLPGYLSNTDFETLL
mmetsp:Transcript_18787/g.32108  ORF Transcript_18787/g.32108 Transcript_18787/m.32108 type:complete len:93 (+) Transcript_18787:123-401(+)